MKAEEKKKATEDSRKKTADDKAKKRTAITGDLEVDQMTTGTKVRAKGQTEAIEHPYGILHEFFEK